MTEGTANKWIDKPVKPTRPTLPHKMPDKTPEPTDKPGPGQHDQDPIGFGTATTDEVRSGTEGRTTGGVTKKTMTFTKTFKHTVRPNMSRYFARRYHQEQDHNYESQRLPAPPSQYEFDATDKTQNSYFLSAEQHRWVVFSHDWHVIPAYFPKCAMDICDLEHFRDAHAYRLKSRKVTLHKAQFQTEELSADMNRVTLGTDNAYQQMDR